jgi:transposase
MLSSEKLPVVTDRWAKVTPRSRRTTAAFRSPDRRAPIKSEEQQAVLALHRIREQLLKQRIALTNQLHGLLLEFGLVLPRRVGPLRARLTALLDDQRVPPLLSAALREQLEHLSQLEQRLCTLTGQLELLARESEPCQRLMRHRGVGPLTATAFAAELADPAAFKNSRQAAAWLGLVSRQHSSGQRVRLLGITKAGNSHLRGLFIHGARSVLRYAPGKTDPLSQWLLALQRRRGSNRAAVALANKTVRHLWATLRYAEAV